MVSYRVAIKSGRSSGNEPSGPTGTGAVGVCKIGSPTMRIGTTAMAMELRRCDDARCEAAGGGASLLGWAVRRCALRSGGRRSIAVGLGGATMRAAKRREEEHRCWVGRCDDARCEAAGGGASLLGWAERAEPTRGAWLRPNSCGHG